jgi:uncharacterized protein
VGVLTGIEIVVALVLGVFVGVVVGLLGAGGSILTVPVLILLLHLSATEATGTSLVVVSIVSTVGLLTHARGSRVAWRAGFGFAATGVPAAVVGGYLAILLPNDMITLVLAILLLGTSAYMWSRADGEDPGPAPETMSWWRIVPAGLVVGLMTGTLGVGGGFVVVPALVILLGLSMPVAIGTSQLVLVLNALAGLTGRVGTGSVALSIGLVFAAGGAVGAVVASGLVARAGGRWLSRAFAVLLVVVAVSLLGELVL